jgi:hypothetical protein
MTTRENYDVAVAERFGLIAEQSLDQCSDALQALTWAAPGDDDLAQMYREANELNERLMRWRKDEGHRDS